VTTELEVEQLRKLTEIGRALTYTTSLEQVAQLTVQRGAGLLDAAGALLMLADSSGQMHVRASHGIDDTLLTRFRAPLGDEMLDRLQGLLGVSEDRFLAVPLVVGGTVTGLVAVALTQPSDTADEWLLSALADQTAVALENARLAGEVRLEMEGRLRASEGATSAKDRALSTLAHDIRTPIGAIDGYCWNMEDEIYGPVTNEQRKVLGRMRMSGRHLLSLLDNVMDMARLNAGVITVTASAVRLSEVAREASELVGPSSAAKLQTLEVREEADVVVSGDQARLRQVLVNLLGNAVKFTPQEGSVTVTTSECYIDDACWGEIRVTDSGPGIAADERAAIFEPYYRSKGAALIQGVGLGLTISRALVAQMGGELRVESEIGRGCSFVVRLPLLSIGATS
jgi:signal transduction histidine kinase